MDCKGKIKRGYRLKPENLRFWTLLYTIWYNFDTILYQFLKTGTSNRCLICIVQNRKFSGFSPFHFSFTVPLTIELLCLDSVSNLWRCIYCFCRGELLQENMQYHLKLLLINNFLPCLCCMNLNGTFIENRKWSMFSLKQGYLNPFPLSENFTG